MSYTPPGILNNQELNDVGRLRALSALNDQMHRRGLIGDWAHDSRRSFLDANIQRLQAADALPIAEAIPTARPGQVPNQPQGCIAPPPAAAAAPAPAAARP